MTAFDHAWTLLKQRGFEVDPRYEDQRLENLQITRDDIDTLRDHRAKVLAEINRLSQLGTPESDAKIQQLLEGGHTSPLAYEMFPAQSLPTGGYVGGGLRDVSDEMHFLTDFDADIQGPPYFNTAFLEPFTGAMFQEQQRQEAERNEAEGIDLPEYPYGEPRSRVSAVPPTGIGRAGSISNIINPRDDTDPTIPRPDFSFNPFDPNEVALRRQTMANEQTPLGQALARIRAGSGPQPLQFDQ